MTGTTLRRLNRERDGRPAAPVRIAHLGPGHFFRAHQAWYTQHAPDAADWGIAAFAGRRGAVARELAAQDGLYTLLVRAADGDRPEIVSSVVAVSAELDDWRRCFTREELALVTLIVTEAGSDALRTAAWTPTTPRWPTISRPCVSTARTPM